jgi:hypothetical protein
MDGLKRLPGKEHNLALGYAVNEIADAIEDRAKRNWTEDSFTQQALAHAIQVLLARVIPSTEANRPIPSAIDAAAEKMPARMAEDFRTPQGFGYAVAAVVIREIEQAASNPRPDEMTQPIFFAERPALLAIIGRDLGLTDAKKGK